MGCRMETADRLGKGTPYKIHHVAIAVSTLESTVQFLVDGPHLHPPELLKRGVIINAMKKFNQISSKRNSTTSVLMSAKAPRHQDVLESLQGRLFKSEVLCSVKSHCSQMACKECFNTEVFALLSFPPLSSFSLFL